MKFYKYDLSNFNQLAISMQIYLQQGLRWSPSHTKQANWCSSVGENFSLQESAAWTTPDSQ